MSDDFSGLRARLTALADGPAPASPFDPARVAATGRRRILALRTSAVGGCAALAMAAVVGIMTAFGPGGPPSPTASSGIGADPLSKLVDFGWLPASLPNVSYVATAGDKNNDVIAQGNKTPDGAPRVDLQLLPDNGPGTPNPDERMIPATLDDGRKAYWVTQSASGGRFAGDFQLRFPTKGGRWASLTWDVNWNSATSFKIRGTAADPTTRPVAAGTPPTSVPVSAAWQQTLLRIATQVTDTAAPTPIPMPLRLTGLPPNVRPATTLLWRPGRFGEGAPGTWSATLEFYLGDRGTIEVDVDPHNTEAQPVSPPSQGAQCTTAAGLDACVWYSGGVPVVDRLGGAKGLLSHITLLGLDEKQWTTEVIIP